MSKKFIIRDPFALQREGVITVRGYTAWRDNVYAAIYLSEILKPCLGPSGMSKIVIDKQGEGVATNHGFSILDKLDLHHPVAKVLREAAKTVDAAVGDGTKSAIILIGELLRKAVDLTDRQHLRVSTVMEGYLIAYRALLRRLKELCRPFDIFESNNIKNLVSTVIKSRGVTDAEYLSELTSRAINAAIKNSDGKPMLDRDALKIVKKFGKSLSDSVLIQGAVIDKGVAHSAMPKIIKNARIAVLNMALKIDEFRHLQPYKYHIDIKAPAYISQLLSEEEQLIQKIVEKILSVGANVVICRKRIGDTAKQMLANAGIMGISRLLNEEAFQSVAKLTGARIVSSVEDLLESDLGRADIVREDKIGDERVVVIEGCNSSCGVTLLLRGVSENILNNVEHLARDSVNYVSSILEEPAYLPGGGAVEEALAMEAKNVAFSYGGRAQEAIKACADCLEVVPRLLAENAGSDPIDVLSELRAKHAAGQHTYGFDAYSRRVADMLGAGTVESYKVKEQVLKTAFETATMLLRIDEVVDRRYAKRHEGELGGQ